MPAGLITIKRNQNFVVGHKAFEKSGGLFHIESSVCRSINV
jgi:hypothetical protein